MEIVYCRSCGTRVDVSDVQRHKPAAVESGGSGAVYCPKCAPAQGLTESLRKSSHSSINVEPKKDRSNKALTPAERSAGKPGAHGGPATPRRASAKHRSASEKSGLGTGTLVLGVAAVVLIILGIFFATESTKVTPGVHPASGTATGSAERARQPEETRVSSGGTRSQDAGTSMALAMLSSQTTAEEEKAEKEWPKLFDGIAADDAQARIKKLEAYVAGLSPDWNISARARVLLANLRKSASHPAAVEAPPPPVEKAVLIGRWKLDDAAGAAIADSSGNGAAANVINAPQRVPEGMQFNGKDTDLELPNSPQLDRVQDGDFSVSAWFKPDGDPAEEADHVHCGYGIILKPGRHLGLEYYHGGYFSMDVWGEQGERKIAVSHSFPPNVFYHLCGVLSRKTGETRLYVNGKLEKTAFWDPNLPLKTYTAERWQIGCAHPDGSEWAWPAKGTIRDVRIYKGALSDAEIVALSRESK